MRFWTFKRKIGVIGLYKSGKTVFLTSLINHLKNHQPHLMALGKGDVKMSPAEALSINARIKAFPYDEHRLALVEHHRWPRKTEHVHQARFQLTRSDWPHTMADLSFLDMPGERLADITMAGRDYATWSDALLSSLKVQREYREVIEDYFKVMTTVSGSTDESLLIQSYKQAQGKLIMGFRPIVTPSSFLLAPQGGYAAERDLEGLVANRYIGITEKKQFAPMNEQARSQAPKLANVFASRFLEYRRKVVDPLATELASCQTLVILVDVTTLLAGGLGMYHGNQELLRQLITYIDPGTSTKGSLARTLTDLVTFGSWQMSGVRRIAFVATKADKVHASQRAHLRGLMQSMVSPLVDALRARKHLPVEYFVVSSAQSTESRDDGRLEAFLPGRDDQPRAFEVSDVPEDWPAQWDAGAYNYPEVRPWMPPRQDLPPRQIEMNLLLDYLMEKMDRLR